MPTLDWQGHDPACRAYDDALDAVVCALLARAASLGLTAGPPDNFAARAATEGWIHLPPAGSLGRLTG